MKNLFKLLVVIISFAGFTSCEDTDTLLFSAPVGSFKIVTPDVGSSVVLSESTPNNPGLSITWSPIDFTTPQVVNYTVQIAKDGSNFATPTDLLTTTNTFASIPMAQFNLATLMSGAVPFVQSAISIRIRATTGTAGAQPTFSDPITYLVTAYGCLNQFAVGEGLTQAGWNWNNPRTLLCNNGVLTMTAEFSTNATGAFRFFTTSGDWNSGRNFAYYTGRGYKIVSTLVNAADGDGNFRHVGPAGNYRLTLDENEKFINLARRTVSTGAEPTSNWLVGAATPGGWSWTGNNETEVGQVSNGVFEVAVRLNNNEAFRVWTANDGGDSWGSPNRNFPYYVTNGYTIDNELVNAVDGDSNFRYIGPTAVRLLKIDNMSKIISVN